MWNRVVLDEAQAIANPKAATTQAVFALQAKYRWCLTGVSPFFFFNVSVKLSIFFRNTCAHTHIMHISYVHHVHHTCTHTHTHHTYTNTCHKCITHVHRNVSHLPRRCQVINPVYGVASVSFLCNGTRFVPLFLVVQAFVSGLTVENFFPR